MTNDVVTFLVASYKFSVRPIVPPNTAPFAINPLVFQSGELTSGDQKLPIIQLLIGTDSEMVTSATTEAADIILADYMARLEDKFKFRFSSAPKVHAYQSNVIIEFDYSLEDKIEAFRKIEAVLMRAGERKDFKIKRLAFGSGDIRAQVAAKNIPHRKRF